MRQCNAGCLRVKQLEAQILCFAKPMSQSTCCQWLIKINFLDLIFTIVFKVFLIIGFGPPLNWDRIVGKCQESV